MQELILYTGPNCHLCEQAMALFNQLPLLLRQRFKLIKIDISQNQQLKHRYGQRIPVIKCTQTKHQLGWPFSLDQLVQWLAEQ